MSNQIQHKLMHYEVPPPEGIWDGISQALDEALPGSVAEKLYQFEEKPPEGSWQKIESALNASPAKVLSFYGRNKRAFRYGGATAAMVILAMLTSLFVSKKSVSELPRDTSVTKKQEASTTIAPVQAPSYSSIGTGAGKILKHIFSSPRRSAFVIPSASSMNTVASLDKLIPRLAERKQQDISNDGFSDKYMVLSYGDGAAVRLPKKLYDAYVCPGNEPACKEKIKKLQEKIATSALSADFAGMLDIIDHLKENN